MDPVTYPLWPEGAPAALGARPTDIPTITLYPPTAAPNGAAMLVFPGGGYEALMDYEGEAYARWLASQGYYGMVVEYRLTPAGYTLPDFVADGSRAVRWARSRAADLGFDPAKIGVIGSSAGGHLCAMLAVEWDAGNSQSPDPVERCSSRPDLAVLCYAVVKHWPGEYVNRLFGGRPPSAEENARFNANERVNAQTAPTFLFHTVADDVVEVGQALLFASALDAHGVPFEAHIYTRGPHGVALGNGHPWTGECLRWLGEMFA